MKNYLSVIRLSLTIICLVVLIICIFEVKIQLAKATSTSQCGGWSTVSSVSPGQLSNKLQGIAAISTKDIWAVGSYSNTDGTYYPLVEHWNGSIWTITPIINKKGYLGGIARVPNTNQIWAVGSYVDKNGRSLTLIEHWDGSIWKIMKSPNKAGNNTLTGVAVISVNDVWAAGMYSSGTTNTLQTLIEHWDGATWSIIPGPNTSSVEVNVITRVPGTKQLWIAGISITSQNEYPLFEHWNGKTWTAMTGAVNNVYSGIGGITAISQNDIWAVGYSSPVMGPNQALFEHWNGQIWSIVSAPNDNISIGIAASSTRDVWAVGVGIEHWDGIVWTAVFNPVPTQEANLMSITSVPNTNQFWAVGAINTHNTPSTPNPTSGSETLIEHYC